tara:strand:- start:16 stop:2544 length:2529 start_codon:yes stop_codon:yes gene_type:complete
MALALLGGAAKAIGGSIVKNVAKNKAKSFITGKKKTVAPRAIKSGGGYSEPGGGGGALTVRPQASLVPSVAPVSASEISSGSKSSADTLTLIKIKVFEIDKFLKGTLAQEKASTKKTKESDEKQKRKKQESALEKIAPKPKGVLKKIAAPAKGLFDGIFNFISNILLGRLLVVLLEKNPDLPGGNLLMFLANMAEKVIDTIIGTLDAFGSFLLFGQQKLDGAKDWLEKYRGNEAGERFDELLGSLTNLFNAAVIVGSVFALTGGGPGKGPKKPTKGPRGRKPGIKPTKSLIRKPGSALGPRGNARKIQLKHGHAARGIYQNSYDNAISKGRTPKQAAETANAAVKKAIKKGRIVSKPQTGSLGGTDKGSSLMKGGLKKAPGRLGLKLFGKQGVKLVSKTFGKIPIMGPLIVAVASLLAGEPIGQAVFKGLGAALGGLLGSFIPIPVIGTILGETIGVLVGDMMYSLILGGGAAEAGAKFMTALKTAMDVGGLIVNFFKEGFGRFFNDFPTVDVPDTFFGAIQKGLAIVFPFFDKDKDGKVGKIPNLSILFNPAAMITQLIPHAAASFLPDIFGKDGTAFGSSESKAPDNKSTSGGDASAAAMPSVSTQGAGLRNQTEGSKIAGELGRYLNREGLKWGSGVTEHPEHGGVKPVHTDGSYHYKEQGYRAIDIGGWGPNRFKREGQTGTDDQTQIIAGIQKFNKDKGVKPIEFITEATDPTYHNDHVHIAYGLGGLVRGLTHAMLGEKGKEFVIDNDSYTAIEGAYPGLLAAINKAKGKDAIEALMAYTDYEKPPEPEMAMMGGGAGGGSGSYGDSGESGMASSNVSEGSSSTNGGWKDIRYKFG